MFYWLSLFFLNKLILCNNIFCTFFSITHNIYNIYEDECTIFSKIIQDKNLTKGTVYVTSCED